MTVSYNLCAISGASPQPQRFSKILKAGEKWGFSVLAAPGAPPIVTSDYCRTGPGAPSCQVTCPTQSQLTSPKWQVIPDLSQSFPEAARRQGVSGRVILACTFNAIGRLENCSVASETPPGMGFGNAALRASRGFKAAAIGKDGKPVAGTAVEVPISFPAPD